jgi:hypothetical protein
MEWAFRLKEGCSQVSTAHIVEVLLEEELVLDTTIYDF